MVTRRDCLKGGALAAGALAASGCAGVLEGRLQPTVPQGWLAAAEGGLKGSRAERAALRTLNRAAFGPRPGDLAQIQKTGLDGWVDEQLAPEKIEESSAVGWRLWRLDTLQADTDFRFALPKEQVQAELQQAAVVQAVYSRRQLQEVMVDFWTDHFNVSQLKGDSAFLKTTEDVQVIRRHALGKFRDLLWASAKSPAMLYYLDNAGNTKDEGNENYARELMELHTLGVDGGYTQRDVQEVARCFTGWSMHGEGAWRNGEFVYRPDTHDDADRRVLGRFVPAGLGQRQGERVLEILAEHPSTARFIAWKLCRRFIADEGQIPHGLVEQLARTFRRTDGDMRQVLSVLLRSEEFRHGSRRKLKRSFDFTVSALRAVNAETDGRGVPAYLQRMGQAPYQWAMPNGYPDRTPEWLPSLLGRWNLAVALVSGQIEGTKVDLDDLMRRAGARTSRERAGALMEAVLGRTGTKTGVTDLTRLIESGGSSGLAQGTALLLSSPAFQWR
jgi:uncharacterized protein (DUF1800 family)